MVKKFCTLIFITCMVIGVSGCRIIVNTAPGIQLGGENNQISGSGVMKTQTRNVDPFTALKVQEAIHVYITQGESDVLTVTAEDNILPYVETRVSGQTLIVGITGNNISLSPKKEIRVDLVVPANIYKIAVSSAGQIIGDHSVDIGKLEIDASSAGHVSVEVNGEGVRVSASSSAQVKLRGQVEQLSVSASSAAIVSAKELQVENASADASSGARIDLIANGTLGYSISSGAVLNYSGEARVTNASVSSGGRVMR